MENANRLDCAIMHSRCEGCPYKTFFKSVPFDGIKGTAATNLVLNGDPLNLKEDTFIIEEDFVKLIQVIEGE
jgi:hypothetical protein